MKIEWTKYKRTHGRHGLNLSMESIIQKIDFLKNGNCIFFIF